MNQLIKSKRIRVYNLEEKKVKHQVFSKLEVAHINELENTTQAV